MKRNLPMGRLGLAGLSALVAMALSATAAFADSECSTDPSEACTVLQSAKLAKSAAFTSSTNYVGDKIPGVTPQSFRLRMAGKYQGKAQTGSTPEFSLNWRLTKNGNSFNIGAIYVKGKFYIRSGNVYYYLEGQKGVKLAQQFADLIEGTEAQANFGIPVDLLSGVEMIGGPAVAPFYHIKANVDMNKAFEQLLADLEEIRAKLPKGPRGKVIGGKAIDRLESSVKNLQSAVGAAPVTFTIGKSDSILRKRSITVAVSGTDSAGQPLKGNYVQQSIFSNVNKTQKIYAPSTSDDL